MKLKKLSLRKKRGIVNAILSLIVLVVMIACILRADYHSVFICILTLMLFNIPFWAEKVLKITLPKELEIIILFFIFAAEILGEIGSFYTYIPWWDTMLHTINGFLMAAIGFALIDLLNNSPKFHITLSPTFVAVVAFCFSMTIGVLWEFFEFGMDMIFHTDMQKDFIVSSIYTVTFNPDGLNSVYEIPEITETVLLKNGEEIYRFNGYLDIGIIDTMKDLIVNFVGAVVFSTIGYFYILGRNKGVFASKFIPQYHTDEPADDKKEKTIEAIAEPAETEEETEITK
ncbi:MAG: hypothetical protein ACI3X1_03595 [Eubacteriales bacterium]